MKKVWNKINNDFLPSEDSSKFDKLPPGIYNLTFNQKIGFYLSRIHDNFPFNYKIYGKDDKFIETVIKSYHSLNNNLGVLLNGTKGGGKSVTAKLICNQLNLPIICVNDRYDENINDFLCTIQQPVIIFIDEYEKIYDDSADLLSLMDGVLNNEYKNLFLLTTNYLYINENLMQRPGRIRYIKTYDNLTIEQIDEIVDDLLKYPEFRNDFIKEIKKLSIITIDLVKEIINEINIHNISPSEFIEYFNVHNYYDSHDIIRFNFYELNEKGEQILLFEDLKYYKRDVKNLKIGSNLIDQNGILNCIIKKNYKMSNKYDIMYNDSNSEVQNKTILMEECKEINRMFNV